MFFASIDRRSLYLTVIRYYPLMNLIKKVIIKLLFNLPEENRVFLKFLFHRY